MNNFSKKDRLVGLLRAALTKAQEGALAHHGDSRIAARYRDLARQITRALKLAEEE